MSLPIGITDCSKWANYESWIHSFVPGMNILRLKAAENKTEQVSQCCGVILTGGEDVHPSYYNKPGYVEHYKLTDLNIERDEFEFSVLKQVLSDNIPLLGICRGLQIANVFLGGTLIPDLPSVGKTTHSGGKNNEDALHPAILVTATRLSSIIGEERGEVNSYHHQAAGDIGKGLNATVFSNDGVIEGLEKQKGGHDAFFTLVQWHPERMNTANPFSGKLGEAFIEACEKYAGNF